MRILIADDAALARRVIGNKLREAGYEVIEAEDGIDAIQKVYQEAPDMVILDIYMPRMNGYLACRLLKDDQAVAHLPVLVLTAHDTAEDRYWAAKSGANRYLVKDRLADELLPAVRAAQAQNALAELAGRARPRVSLDSVDVLTKVTEMLDRRLFEMSLIGDIRDLAMGQRNLRETLSEMLFVLRRFVEYDRAGVGRAEEMTLAIRLDLPLATADLDGFQLRTAASLGQHTRQVIPPDRLHVWRTDEEVLTREPFCQDGWLSFYAMPLRTRGRLIGMVAVASHKPGVYTEDVIRNVRLTESPIASLLEVTRQDSARLSEEARTTLSSLYSSNPD